MKLLLITFGFIISVTISIFFITTLKAKKIESNFINSENCNKSSTREFRNGNSIEKEYILYRCRINPNIRTLYIYADAKTNEAVYSKIINTDYESIEGASPRVCEIGAIEADNKNIYEICYILINYENIFGFRKEFFFSTPIRVRNIDTTRKDLRENTIDSIVYQN
ncbi:hypothetical protein [Psychrobacter aestuarii]|uniref:Uncharacterized protein n=1 Tax=Psychrobacter aestuarii TaxID=556327 RepID=A0ABN0VRZ2_9GAMM|nr:hypothetical protein [Psychrobacter aestuarii]